MVTIASLPSNFPTPPAKSSSSLLTHPRDLIADGRNFYSQIQFVPYDSNITGVSSFLGNITGRDTGSANPTGGIVLPIPQKLNDVQTIVWEEIAIAAGAAGIGAQMAAQASIERYRRALQLAQGGALAASALSVLTGYQLNPMLWMIFRSPQFKNHTLSWTLAANNEQESHDIANIINYFKRESLPATTLGGVLYEYPSIALIRFYPNNFFTFRLKPCVVQAVAVDYSAAGQPSFFKNGAPTIVNLTVVLKEIELWTKNNFFR